MEKEKNVTKREALTALAYLELVAENNSENERFITAFETVKARMLHLEASFATIADRVRQTE